jgi:type IV fimbrial biogenesis protein FimT
MVTLTVLGIMLGLGIPSFKNIVQNQKVKSASYDIAASLLIARSEAVNRKEDVTIEPETADTWTSGWTVKTATTTLLKQQALPLGITVTKGPSTVVFNKVGRPTNTSNFEVASTSSTIKCVKVDTTGIPSTQSVACP